jgi:asparagine synthase (glutamine-hydrolysing)
MSGFTAIFNRDGRPLDKELLGAMNDEIRHRGPDGSGCWTDASIGLAHQMMRTTTASLQETQPAVSTSGAVVLVYDGLIDNAVEIRIAAREARLRVDDTTDATAILLAYQLWRDECAMHLSGDFAFVIWDRIGRRLLCARDPLGIRPLYYHLSDRFFACGTELRQLLRHPDIRQDVNEGMAAEYAANNVTTPSETLYRHIQRLPAGYYLVVNEERHRVRRYWFFDPTRRVRFRTDEQYGEALLEEIRTAVRACARAAGPLGVETNGDLDAASVAASARQITDSRGARLAPHTFSLAYPGLECDVEEFVSEAETHWQTSVERVTFELPSRAAFESSYCAHRDFPETPDEFARHSLYRAVRDRGCRVLLSGLSGDDCLAGHVVHCADLLREFKLRDLRRQLEHDKLGRQGLYQFALRPLVPAPAQRVARAVQRGYPSWIADRFARRVALADRLDRRRFDKGLWQSRAQEELFRQLTHGWTYHVRESLNRVAAEHGIEVRNPLLRLNVVEFGLAIPEEQRWRGSETRFALRQAMKGLLPENLRTRTGKTDFSILIARLLSHLDAAATFRSLHLVSLGWLDGRHVSQMQAAPSAWQQPLWMIYGLERWLATTPLLDRNAPPLSQAHAG